MPRNPTRSSLRVLRDDFDLLPGEASLDDFVLTPPTFRPQRDGEILDDEEPISRLGQRARKAFAEANEIDQARVPHGLIRLVELMSADDHANERSLSATRLLRNRLGTLVGVPFVAHSPLIFPWLVNGRALQRMARLVRENTKLLTSPTDHDILKLPVLEVQDVAQVLEHYDAQRQVLGLHEYTGADRDFVDDVAMNGVLEEIVLTPTYVSNSSGGTWTGQATDGAQRVTAEHELIRMITGDSPAIFQRAWQNDDGSFSLHELTAEKIRRLHDEATFQRNELQLFPASSSDRAVERWREQVADRNREVAIFQRVRTVRAVLVLAAKPNQLTASPSQVILEDVRARHIEGATREPWDDAAVRSQIAVGCIEEVHSAGLLTDAERDVAIGNAEVPWRDAAVAEGRPYRNRLIAISSLAGLLTATEPGRDRLKAHLRLNHQWPHPNKRARVVADQALVILGREGHRQADQIASAMSDLFKSKRWWKTEDHPCQTGDYWPDVVTTDVDTLLDAAKDELTQPRTGSVDPQVDVFGPARRALGMLGGLAFITNPALVDFEYPDGNRGGQLSQSGRGGRLRYSGPSLITGDAEVRVGTSDPASVIAAMLRRLEGLDELAIAIRAATEAAPDLPLHPDTGEVLDDAYLRYRWLGTDGTGPNPQPDVDPITEYWSLVDRFFESLGNASDTSLAVKSFVDDDSRRLFYEFGLTDEQVQEAEPTLAALQRFVIEAGFVRSSGAQA